MVRESAWAPCGADGSDGLFPSISATCGDGVRSWSEVEPSERCSRFGGGAANISPCVRGQNVEWQRGCPSQRPMYTANTFHSGPLSIAWHRDIFSLPAAYGVAQLSGALK